MNLTRRFVSSRTSKTVCELFYDILSPYSYVQFELLTRQKNHWKSMSLRHTPASLGGVIRASNNTAPVMVPAKKINLINDMNRLTDYFKIPYKMYPNFPEFAFKMGSLKTQRFLSVIESQISEQQYESLIRAFYQSLFSPTKSLDISNVDVIRQIANDVDVDKVVIDKALDAIGTEEVKKKLIDNSQRVVDAGGFGLPTTLIHLPNGVKMVFGCDRMHIVGHLFRAGARVSGALAMIELAPSKKFTLGDPYTFFKFF